MPILIIGARDVRELLPYAECADVMRDALAAVARGEVHQPLRSVIRPPGAAGLMALMPAYRADGYGLKAICVTPGNPAVGKDAHQGGVLLFSAAAGEPVALVNATAITEIRTAAVSAVATGLLAAEGDIALAVIGTGVQARAHLRAMAASTTVTRAMIAGRDREKARRLATEITRETGITAIPAASAEEAVKNANVVITATSAAVPVLRREWLSPGTHVNAVGSCVPDARELDAATMAEAALFADSRDSMLTEAGDYVLAAAETGIGPSSIRAEIGEILAGAARGRTDPGEITVFESLGLAAEDLAAALHVYRKAIDSGAGTRAEFQELPAVSRRARRVHDGYR